MDITIIIGSLAAFLTTLAFIPQALKVFKTRDTSGISLWMYIIFTTGVGLWLVYGVCKSDLPIIIANTVTIILASTILVFKLKEKK